MATNLTGTVFATSWDELPHRVVKIINPYKEEADILDSLQRDLACPANHVIPCDLIHSDKLFAIMPCLTSVELLFTSKISSALDAFDQILEASDKGGIAYLQNRRIAHMDLCAANVLAASVREAAFDLRVKAGKLYIIDFDRSRRFDLKVGGQGAIVLPSTVCRPLPGITHLDPYSWDMYCAGKLLRWYLRGYYGKNTLFPILDRYTRWVIGDERGCGAVCRCRPSAHQARQALAAVRWAVYAWECFHGILTTVRIVVSGHSSPSRDTRLQ
ncbi:hypothetical protein BD309DRAFT_984685 [Dichomitus squalens]|nr:hypothetical protein BD309DRAFT_984685 [Dichomitus squalens]